MPTLPDGRTLDICINPLGIISRMNVGQLFELHLTMAFYDLKQNINKMFENNTQKEIKDYLLGFIKIIDKTKDNWYYNQFVADNAKQNYF
jgi:DNA-directed RNA polymerase subunit beta